ncbi:MAG: 3,4-dihydroxyphenylacetate 2,3-dioxygenase [Acidobacteriota bacterium]|nr:3,4-dihydroxyphenylacetate 2,3-dioxygenase [Acidobacteriota bacterium]
MSPPHIVRIGHVILQVASLAASRAFYVDLLGLDVVAESPRHLCLRGVEEREWSLMLEQHPEPAVRQVGFKVAAEQELDALEDMARRLGLATGRRQEPERPSVLTVQDPFGMPLAFYFASGKHPWLLQQYHRRRCPSIQRIDHVNVFAANPGAALAWYRDVLGFRLTEYTEDDDGQVWAAWLHRKGNVHDVAFTNGAGPRLHHVAFWMPDLTQVMQLCDVLGASRTGAIERGPGRHGISNALFLYLRDPDGHRVEIYTSDYLTVDPDFEPVRWARDDPYRQQLWGGLAPRSWFTEGSPFRQLTGELSPLTPPALEGLPSYIS